jgi:NAD+ kinase
MGKLKVLLIGNVSREVVRATMDRLEPQLAPLAEVTRRDLECEGEEASCLKADLALVVGGDGSILKAARCLAPAGTPCLGVNIGRLGFLAGYQPEEIESSAAEILRGGGRRVERIMLDVRIEIASGRQVRETALNDVVVGHGPMHRMIGVEVDVDREVVATYHGDGVLVSTPTGSTAYNLAAGGPILDGQLAAMVITPICPHMLTHRSMVVGSKTHVQLRPTKEEREASCIIDGQIHEPLVGGDVVDVRVADRRFVLIENPKRSSFETLREKLHWSHPPRYANGG